MGLHRRPQRAERLDASDVRTERPAHLGQWQPHAEGRLRIPQHRGDIHDTTSEQGLFYFDRGTTGLLGVNSGSPIASFLLGAVNYGFMVARDTNTSYPRQAAWIVHVGDTWRATDRLTLNYGLRWDYSALQRRSTTASRSSTPRGPTPGPGAAPGAWPSRATSQGGDYGAEYPEKRSTGRSLPAWV